MIVLKSRFFWEVVAAVIVFFIGQFRGRAIERALLAEAEKLKASARKTAGDMMRKLPGQGGHVLFELVSVLGTVATVVFVANARAVWGNVFICVMFVLGIGLHVLLQAWVVVNGGKPNGGNPLINSYRVYFKKRGVLVAVRSFASICLLMIYIGSKGSVAIDTGPGGAWFNWQAWTVLARAGSVGVYGLLSDFFLDKVFARLGWQDALEGTK